jgi:hypothetical protein
LDELCLHVCRVHPHIRLIVCDAATGLHTPVHGRPADRQDTHEVGTGSVAGLIQA